jgi:hypothetical protein
VCQPLLPGVLKPTSNPFNPRKPLNPPATPPPGSYFSYTLCEDSLRLSETGAAFLEDLLRWAARRLTGADRAFDRVFDAGPAPGM